MDFINLQIEDESFIQLQCTVPKEQIYSKSISQDQIQLQCTAPDQITVAEKMELSTLSHIQFSTQNSNNSNEPVVNLNTPEFANDKITSMNLESPLDGENMVLTGELANPDALIIHKVIHSTANLENLIEFKSQSYKNLNHSNQEEALKYTKDEIIATKTGSVVTTDNDKLVMVDSLPTEKKSTLLEENKVSNLSDFDVMKMSKIHPMESCHPYNCLTPPSQILPTPTPPPSRSKLLAASPQKAQSADDCFDFDTNLLIPNQKTLELVSDGKVFNSALKKFETQINDQTNHGDCLSVVEASIIEDYDLPMIPAPAPIDYFSSTMDDKVNTILFLSFQFIILDDSGHIQDLIAHRGGHFVENFPKDIRTDLQVILIAKRPDESMEFLYSLASNVPKIASFWIDDCIEANDIISFQGYHLANGYVKDSPIFATYVPHILDGVCFNLDTNEWQFLLAQCGAELSSIGLKFNSRLFILSLIQQKNLFKSIY
eukprot:NODE_435_length_7481_cov_1.616364.p2 type:complete len:487 gc:universal NODE_435_length_7481_cov_1.616364:3522-4982(+)